MSQENLPFKVDLSAAKSGTELNTKISYSYHCAGNYGKDATIIVAGEVTQEALEAIACKLYDSECFLPKQVGIDSLAPDEDSDEYDAKLDHPLHKFEAFELTSEDPTVVLTLEQFLKVFDGLNSEDDWDFLKYSL